MHVGSSSREGRTSARLKRGPPRSARPSRGRARPSCRDRRSTRPRWNTALQGESRKRSRKHHVARARQSGSAPQERPGLTGPHLTTRGPADRQPLGTGWRRRYEPPRRITSGRFGMEQRRPQVRRRPRWCESPLRPSCCPIPRGRDPGMPSPPSGRERNRTAGARPAGARVSDT